MSDAEEQDWPISKDGPHAISPAEGEEAWVEERGWVLERTYVKPEMIHYFGFVDFVEQGHRIRHWSWTSDNLKAARFARREDALACWNALVQGDPEDVEAVEHMWCGQRFSSRPSPPPAFETLASSLGYPWLPCPICRGTEGCDHSVPERARAHLALHRARG